MYDKILLQFILLFGGSGEVSSDGGGGDEGGGNRVGGGTVEARRVGASRPTLPVPLSKTSPRASVPVAGPHLRSGSRIPCSVLPAAGRGVLAVRAAPRPYNPSSFLHPANGAELRSENVNSRVVVAAVHASDRVLSLGRHRFSAHNPNPHSVLGAPG